MKLKNKRISIFTIMCTMSIGLLTLSINQVNPNVRESINTKESIQIKEESEINLLVQDNENSNNYILLQKAKQAKILFTQAPEPTQTPVYNLQEGGYPEIEAFIEDYYAAKITGDIDKLKSMSTNPSVVMSKEVLESLTEGIEEYNNIKCYTKKSMIEGTYFVYAYHEIKFIGIDTPAPALSRFYIVTDENVNLKMFDNEMDEKLRDYSDERNNDTDVIELMEMTNKMGAEARAKDEDLLYFWNIIGTY